MNFHVTGIWGWLLKPLLALCMLGFAAGGTVLGGDMGGGGLGLDDGGGGEGGEGGEFEGGEGEGSFAGGEGGEEDIDLEDGGQQDQGRQLTPQQRADAAREKALPANVKKALAAVRETDAKAADILRRAMFGNQAWTRVFPEGIRQARELATAFEEVGGAEGIRGLQDEVQSLQGELDQVDTQWKEGKPEFFAGLAEEDPEAFARNVPLALAQLNKSDKESYNAVTGRIFWNTLQGWGALETQAQLWNLANMNKTAPGMAGIIEGLQHFAQIFQTVRELAANQPERKPDKAMEKLKQRETDFERKQAEGFKKEVHGDIKRHLETGIVREVGKLLKARGVNIQTLRFKEKDRFEALVAEADRRLAAAINGDRKWLETKDRLMGTRDRERVLRLYQQKIDSLLQGPKGIAKAVTNVFFRGVKPGPRQNGQGGQQQNRNTAGDGGATRESRGGGNGGGGNNDREVRVGKSPEGHEIDRNRTSDEMILDGHAYLKGGKHVRWRG